MSVCVRACVRACARARSRLLSIKRKNNSFVVVFVVPDTRDDEHDMSRMTHAVARIPFPTGTAVPTIIPATDGQSVHTQRVGSAGTTQFHNGMTRQKGTCVGCEAATITTKNVFCCVANLELVKLVQRRVVFEEVLAGTEIPGGWGGRIYIYTQRYTITTRMTPALRWAAMRAVLKLHLR